MKKDQKIIHEIKCRFCGIVTGKFEMQKSRIPEGVELNDAFFKIDDSRCENCQNQHGSYKEMHDMFMNTTGSRFDDFKNLISQSEYDAKKFIRNVMKFCPEKVYHQKGKFENMQNIRHDIETELGIRDFEHDEKLAIVKNSQMDPSKISAEKTKVEQEKAKKK